MTDGDSARARVVVIGGGIAGLAAAYRLRRHAPPGTVITVVEGSGHLGGKLRTSPVEGLPVDEGAETFLARVPEAVDLATDVGLGGELVHPDTTSARLMVGGAARPLPAGMFGIPGDLVGLRASGVLSEAGYAAVEAEAGLPAEPLVGDVAVGEYVGRRMGREVVDRLVDPLLGGVYAGRADLLSLRATMPGLAAALDPASGAGPRSLLAVASAAAGAGTAGAGAARAGAAGGGAAGAGGGRAASAAPAPVFATLRSGLGTLPAAVARASGAEVRCDLVVRDIERTATGFRLTAGPVPRPEYLTADAVVVAVPAGKAAGMLAGIAPPAATELRAVEYANIGLVTLAYPLAALPPGGLTGSGLLVPATEGRSVKAATFFSLKWGHLRRPGGPFVLRASVGRHGEAGVLHRADADLAALVAGEVAELTGITGAPVTSRVSRWGGGLPQYEVGHLDRVRRIRAAVADVPGLAVCGAVYDGVGVPACIRSGYTAADRVLAHLRTPSGPGTHVSDEHTGV